jgi:aspartate/methionine/tyrosine aminotransferase
MSRIEPSGIRRMFELMTTMQDPINLSIGQPDYDPPEPLIEAACRALRSSKNRYTVTQGLPELNARILADVQARHGRRPENCLVTAGVSGGLVLAFLALLDPGDEILLPDPGFMMYRHLASVVGATARFYSIYPDRPGERFRLDADELASLCNSKTKIVFLNSPSNPTGCVFTRAEVAAACRVAERVGAFVVSDEIYDFFSYETPCASPVGCTERVIQLGGFSKTYGVPGWRLGYATGPAAVLEAMKTLQQFTFVCAPAPFQYALLEAAFDLDMQPYFAEYRHKRDALVEALHPAYGLLPPEGTFYAFPQLPGGVPGDRFLAAALERKLLVVLGKSFSRRDTHFRLSFAADDATLQRGAAALNELAAQFA